NGILIKGGDTIETFAGIKNIVFDKTGTLTTGEFKIQEIKSYDFDLEEMKSILASLESHSSHPIAKSICSELKYSQYQNMSEIEETKGLSISGKDKDDTVYKAGSYAIAKNVTTDESHNIYVLKNEKLIGTVDISDTVKPEAKSVIERLKRKGIKTIMLSGDNQANCERV